MHTASQIENQLAT